MNYDTKNNVTLGFPMTVPIVITKKQINQETKKEEEIITDSEEAIILRPAPIKYWAELEDLNVYQFQVPLVMYTCRKSREWVENVLNPNFFETLYKKCEEMNTSFFARQDLIIASIERNKHIQDKIQVITGQKQVEETTKTEQSTP